jgi:hypothetical protein
VTHFINHGPEVSVRVSHRQKDLVQSQHLSQLSQPGDDLFTPHLYLYIPDKTNQNETRVTIRKKVTISDPILQWQLAQNREEKGDRPKIDLLRVSALKRV